MTNHLRPHLIVYVVGIAVISGSCATSKETRSAVTTETGGFRIPAATPEPPLSPTDTYRKAKSIASKDPRAACKLWADVSQDATFPLASLARLRALETCKVDQEKKLLGADEIAKIPRAPWYAADFNKAALKRAVNIGDTKWEAALSYEVARAETNQALQITLLQRALSIAGPLNDTAMIDKSRALLYQIAPRFLPNPNPNQYLSVGIDFRRARQFEKARDYFDKVISMDQFSDTDKLRALDGVRMSYKLQKNTDKFLRATKDYANFARWKFFEGAGAKVDFASFLQAQISLARALWTDNSPKRAEQVLVETERELGGRTFLGESALVRARIAEERGDHEEAVRILDPFNKDKNPFFRAKTLWYSAWNLRKVGHLAESAKILEDLIPLEVKYTSSLARDQYWLARTHRELGDGARANTEFEALIDSDPLGFYGVLAYRELGRPLPPLEAKSIAPSLGPDPLLGDERSQFELLLTVNEDEVASRLLESIGAGRRAAYSQDQAFELLRNFARTGIYQGLFARLTDLSANDRVALLNTQPELVFPLRFSDEIHAAATRAKLLPAFVYSITRQESAFNPRARSGADAFGLMQLIPEVAKRAQTKLGLKLDLPEDLYKPDVNTLLGAAFLRSTLDRWKGAFIPTVASYNASEKVVMGWLKTRAIKDPVAFIEDVPYEETRNYLKLVTRNFVFYSRLNSGRRPIPFPDWCLGDLQGVSL